MEYLIVLVPVFPMLMAVVSYLFSDNTRKQIASISVATLTLTFIGSVVLLIMALNSNTPIEVRYGESWGILLFDPLSALMSVVIAGISLIVHSFSVRYMADEEGYHRFFVLLGLMTSSLLLMVSSGDLITLLAVWHLIGIFLYFLLGQNTNDAHTQRYAQWTLLTYRIGDLPLIVAAALLYDAFGTWSLSELFDLIEKSESLPTYGGWEVTEIAGILIAFSAFARSAQFLLHTWLPYTMAGPTPVSALMHAGIVNAGGFLINRFAPLYMQTSDVLHLLFIVGLVTAIIGSFLMLTQNDIKKALGYSTMGQMGFMIMECGVGAFSLAVFHLIAHGLFKGTLFLSAGTAIHKARKSDGVPKNDLYEFVVDRKKESRRQPWLIMALMTLIIPIVVFASIHGLVVEDYFQKQGAIVLLFFGWVTGAQLIFASYKMKTTNPWRLFTMIVFSFVVVVVGYTYISHAFEVFLYPSADASNLLYEAAGIELIWFELFVVIVSLMIIFGWFMVFYADKSTKGRLIKESLWLDFYALISRELYVIEVLNWFARRIFAIATTLNKWMRWV